MSKLTLALFAVVAVCPLAVATAQEQAPKVVASYPFKPGDDACISPSGRLLAHVTNRTLTVLDLAHHTSHTIANVPAWAISWAPKEDGIVFVRGDDAGEGEYVWYAGVNPSTGALHGTPRRVSLSRGDEPAISHDGRWVAYEGMDRFPDALLTVVPSTGGASRVLAHLDHGFEGVHWSADDKSVYFGGPTEDGWGSVFKISAAGGKPAQIAPDRVWLAGMTPDRRFIVTLPAIAETGQASRGTVIDTVGKAVGTFALPPHEISEYDEVVGDSGLLWVQIVDHKSIALRQAGAATATRLPLVGRTDFFPAWSADSRHVAFFARRGDNYTLVTANADGSGLHEFTSALAVAGDRALAWSPDGGSIAYVGSDHQSVWTLNTRTGTTHRLFMDAHHSPNQLRWRADGRSVVFIGGVQPAGSRAAVEVPLSGTWKELGRTSRAGRAVFASDSTIAFRSDSTQGFVTLAFQDTGPSVAIPRHERTWLPAVSPDGRQLITPVMYEADKRRNFLDIVDTASRTRRVIELPFTIDVRSHQAALFAGGTEALVIGMQHSADSTSKLYAVPLDGGQPRILDDVGFQPMDTWVTTSPDGRHIAYTVEPTPTTENLLLLPLPRAARHNSRGTPR